MDGILGMSPGRESRDGPSYMHALKEQGVISEAKASFWINSYGDNDSYVFIGGDAPGYASQGGDVWKQKLYKNQDQWWTIKMHSVEYGGDDIKDSGIGYAIIDSGTSLLYLGTEDYQNFLNKVLSSVPTDALDCTTNVYCFSNSYTCDELTPYMEPLMIQLENNYYTLPPEAYTFSAADTRYQNLCTVAVTYTDSSSGIYILGDTFMRNFVTTFDYDNYQIEMTKNIYAPDGVSVEWKLSGWMIFGIVVGGLVFIALVTWLILCCCKRQKAKKAKKNRKGYTIGQYNHDVEEEIIPEGRVVDEEQKLVGGEATGQTNNSEYKSHWANKKPKK